MMKAFSFLTILESLSKKLSILRTKMHSDDLRVNHGTITRLLRVSRPFSRISFADLSRRASFGTSRRVSHFAAILLFLMVSVSPVSAQYDLFGYGRNATGGGNAKPILVDTEQELIDALSGEKSDRVVIITANITVSTQFTSKGSNITLLALPGRCLISNGQSSQQSGILNMRGSNIIIRNVTFIGPGAYDCDGKDLLQFEDATNAWVDHCDFQDGCDGNFDIKSNSDNITVTWCRFRYLKPAKAGGSGGSNDHRYTNLLGSSSSAKPADGTYNVSYAYNWWDNGCKERMVRCRNCEIHFFNCYWNSNVANYYVGPENAKCYFEGCTFAGNANEADKIFKSYGGTNACRFVNSVGNLPSNQGTVNTPSYSYFVESASDAVASITDANCGAGATLVVEADGSITTCGANLTKYTVTFNLNGKGTNFTQEVYENRTIAAPATPTTSGFVFGGWYTEAQCTNAFDFSTPITANRTLYAKWVQAMTVTFNLNGKGTNFTQEVVSGGKASVPSNPTAAGYIFAGWYTDEQCTTAFDFNTTITAAKTIYAKWEETNYCYEFTPATSGDALVVGSVIAGNANSGGTMKVSSLKQAESISYDEKGLKFSSGSADIVTVTLDNYLQAGSIISLTLVSGGSSDERGLDILDANGKDVSELVWEVSASGEERTLSYEVTNDDNLVGTKVFQLQRHNSIYLKNITVGNCGGTSLPTYTITYKANGGTGDDIVAAETMTVANCTFTAPTGYEFSGWNTAADGSGTDYAVGRAINADVTLYAQWTENVVTPDPTPGGEVCVTFGEGKDISNGTTTTDISGLTITTSGVGENASKIDNDKDYIIVNANSQTINSFKIYAKSDAAAKLFFSEDGNTYSEVSLSLSSNKEWAQYASVPANTKFIKIQRSSKSIYLDEICVGVASASAASQTAITLSPQGGTDGTTEVTATKDEAMPEITIPTRTGYNFQGYFTANGGSGTKYYNADGTSAQNWDKDDATFTLIAYWTAKTTNVTLNANGGTGGSESVTATYGSAMTTITPATLAGYALTGYFDAASGGTKYYKADGTSNKNWDKEAATTTLYAQWECTAPTDVKISGEYVHFPGETLTLTVSGNNLANNATYTWKKGGQVIAGQTTATLTINSCEITDAGNYTCTISNGGSCEATADFTIKMYSLRGLIDWSTDCSFTKVNATTATYSMELAGSSSYDFKVYDGSVYYGNTGGNPTMTSANCTNWTMQENTGNNVTLQTTASGTYTFTLDYSDASNLKISVTYPAKRIVYLNPNIWASDNPKFAIHAWGGAKDEDLLMTKIDDCDDRNIYFAEIDATHTHVIFIRGNKDTYNITNPWQNVWNQTVDLQLIAQDLFTVNEWGDGKSNGEWTSFTPNYTVTFDANGHGTAPADQCIAGGGKATTPTEPTETGYTFGGWYKEAGCTNAWDFANGVVTSDITLYAKWTVNTYQITYKEEDRTTTIEGLEPTTYTYGVGVAELPTPSEKIGYTFDSWYSEYCIFEDEEGANNPGHGWVDDCKRTSIATTDYGNVTFLAKYIPNTYTVTFNTNEGTINAGDINSYTFGVGATLPTDVTKENYTFLGWFDNEGLTGTAVTTIPTNATGNKTYWAKWENNVVTPDPILYTITFDTDGGSVVGAMTQTSEGAAITLPTPTRDSYVFNGWYINGITYGAGDTYTPTANITAYAIWQAECTATGGGSGGETGTFTLDYSTQSKDHDLFPISALQNQYTYNDFTRNNNLIVISDKASFVIKNQIGVTITSIRAEGVAANNSNKDVQFSITDGENTVSTTKTEWNNRKSSSLTSVVFDGVSNLKMGAGQTYTITNLEGSYQVGVRFVITYTTTSSGGGSGECYYVTYNGNGAESGFVSDPTAYHSGNTTVTVKENGFTKTGYTFNGWNTAANGSGTSYAAGATFTIEADVELFAQWTENAVTPDPGTQYTVTFNANGHGTAPAAQKVAGGGTITEPTNLTAQDHVFLGWYTDQACTTAFNFSTAINSDITLYAKWNEMDILMEDRCWNISEFETCTITAPQTINQLHIVATPDEEIIIDEGSKKIADINFTNRLKYGGKGSLTTRNLWFSVKGNCQVDIYMMSANSTQTRHLGVATGSFTNVVATFDASPTPAKVTYEYTGGPTTIFLYPTDNGLNIYQICVKYVLPSCTTPELSSLTNQTICEGENAEAWTAEITNGLADGEKVSYQWTKRGNATILSEDATYQLNDVTEAMGGTYVLTAIVSADGKSSATASTEVTLTVIPATEVPTITTDKQKVYTGNSVTLTATTGTPTGVTYQWYTYDDAEGTNATAIEGATNNAYTLASAGDAGTYYYKVIVTGDGTHSCGTAEAIFPLVVSTPSACETFVWYNNGVQPERFEFASTPKGTSGINASMTIDGVTYTNTYRSSDWNSTLTFTIEENHVATFYIYAESSGSARTLTLEDDMQSNTTTLIVDDYDTYASTELTAGTWTLTSSGNIHISMIGLLVCSTAPCTDSEVTATVDNAVICAGNEAVVKFTANNAADGAEFQWQKHNGTSWENISGATNATYTINPVAAENTGKYRVIAEAGCKRISNELTLTVLGTPVFNTFNTAQSVMTRSPLSISDVQATNATGYTWYKSADATFNSAEDTQIGNTQDLMISSVAETAGSTFYLFCLATNSCGTTESQAITVTVTELVEEECATPGNEAQAELFSFTNSSCSKGTYNSTPVWDANGGAEYLTYKTQDGKLFETAKVTIAHSAAAKAVYGYSTDGGSNWTYVETDKLTTDLTEVTIEFPEGVNAFCIGRNISGSGKGTGSGHFYLAEACFTYANTCTETTLTPSEPTKEYNLSVQMDFVEPTFTLKSGETTLTANLTYSSSNSEIATVDEEGNLTFTGMTGNVTITATYAGGTIDEVDYCACQGSYTITVGCKDQAPKIIAAAGTNLNGCNNSITLEAKMQDGTTAFADGTFQWYRDGVAIEGATGTSYEVVRAGTYTVWRTNTCTLVSTNSAVVTNENLEPNVERLTPFQYYHADKNYSAQMKDRHLFAVTSYGTYEGKRYHLTATRNGETVDVSTSTAFSVITSQDNVVDTVMIDLNQLKGKYSEGDEIVITCTAVNSCNELSVINNSITIHVIDKTPVLALICSGAKADGTGTRVTAELTVGGDFLTGYNPADLCKQTSNTTFDPNTEWGFYTELKKNYIVVPVNGYAQFNKLNYEPFDVLLLTDYPKSSHSEAAQKIIDDMAELCDYRPLLSFKTHFQSANWAVNGEYKYNKWTKKGFVTAPVVPAATGTYVNIVCYAHPMFEEIQAVQGSGSIAFHDYDDHNQLVYEMLTGPGHESGKGIQGFELEDANSFVTIGLVHYNATVTKVEVEEGGEDHVGDGEGHHTHVQWTSGEDDRLLVAIAERQANIEARMILFSINCGAQSLQTEGGRQVILECLKYLYDPDNDDPELIEVADCHLTFDNGAGNIDFDEDHYQEHGGTGTLGDGLWTTAANWAPKYDFYPSANNEVRIAAPCTIDIPNAAAFSVQIVEEGKITINTGKALTVRSTITRYDKDNATISPTESEDIFIGSNEDGNGTLIFNNDAGETKATVEMYSTAEADMENMSAAASTWQYIGTPHSDVQNAANNYYESWLYQYNSTGESWDVIPNGGPLVPFRGYCITHPETPHTYTMTGTLTATTSHSAEIPAGKYVVIANSWTAPIQVANFEDDDLENLTDKTVYLFNTGSDPEGDGTITPDASATQETRYAAGTYISIPIHSASYTGDATISSMQGFYVVGGTSDGAVHLDYDKLVRPKEGQSIVGPPMHAPKRIAAQEQSPIVLKMIARGSRYDDNLFVLEREDFTRGYDSGWDGEEWGGSDVAPILYTTNENFIDQTVCAIPDMEGTLITFRAGEDNEYTFHFDYNEMAEALYLLDIDTQIYTRVLKGNSYTFTCTDKAEHNRFILTHKAPQIATGTEHINTGENAKAVKFIKDDKIFIFVNGMLYDATGKIVIR